MEAQIARVEDLVVASTRQLGFVNTAPLGRTKSEDAPETRMWVKHYRVLVRIDRIVRKKDWTRP